MNESKCPFCPIIKKKEWFYVSKDNIIVCRDLNNRQYKYRILVVGSGEYWHRPKAKYSEPEINRFIGLGMEIAQRHIQRGAAQKIVHIDIEHLTIKNHWHCQVCLS